MNIKHHISNIFPTRALLVGTILCGALDNSVYPAFFSSQDTILADTSETAAPQQPKPAPKKEEAAKPAPQQAAPATPAPKLKKSSHIVVKVGKDIISSNDIYTRCRLLAILSSRPEDAAFMKQIRSQVVQQLIDEAVYEQLAQQSQLNLSEEEENGGIESYMKNFGAHPEKLKKVLQEAHTFDSFRKMVRGKIINSVLVMNALPKDLLFVSENQIDQYIERMEKSEKQRQFFVSEIVLFSKKKSENDKTKHDMSAKANADRTYALLQDMRQKMSPVGAFHSIAQQLSQGPTASDGGARGWFSADRMDRAMACVQKMDVRDYSKPVRISEEEYRIFCLEDVKEPGFYPDSEAMLEFVHVAIPCSEDMPEEEQAIIQRRIPVLLECTSVTDLMETAEYYQYKAQKQQRPLGTLTLSVKDMTFNKCLNPFFDPQRKILEILMPLQVIRKKYTLKIDRKDVRARLENQKRAAAAEKLFNSLKQRTLIEYCDN